LLPSTAHAVAAAAAAAAAVGAERFLYFEIIEAFDDPNNNGGSYSLSKL
jgi:hypothetical protein